MIKTLPTSFVNKHNSITMKNKARLRRASLPAAAAPGKDPLARRHTLAS